VAGIAARLGLDETVATFGTRVGATVASVGTLIAGGPMSVAESHQPPVLMIVGVSGCGKSTVAGEIISRLRPMPVSALAQCDQPADDVA